MGRLRILTPVEVVRILEHNGFVRVRQSGSHAQLQRRIDVTVLTVTVPMHRRDLRRGTLQAIVERSRLPHALFEEPN